MLARAAWLALVLSLCAPHSATAVTLWDNGGPTFLHGSYADLDMVRSVAPSVRVVIVPDAGHFVHVEAPAEVNAALEAFMASLTPGGSRPATARTTHEQVARGRRPERSG